MSLDVFRKMNEHVWLMSDSDGACGYLVTGSKIAAVIDTMNGIADVKAAVRRVTDLPVIIINTHGHPDHILGNVFFNQSAYLNSKDLDVVRKYRKIDPDFALVLEKAGLSDLPPFIDMEDGDVFDLGSLHLKVIAVPGHTPGSVCLLLEEDRILFAGDSINHAPWLFLNESLPLSSCLESLERISWVTGKADRILHGHGRSFEDISLLPHLTEGIRDLIRDGGEDDTEQIEFFDSQGYMHRFGDKDLEVYPCDKGERIYYRKD